MLLLLSLALIPQLASAWTCPNGTYLLKGTGAWPDENIWNNTIYAPNQQCLFHLVVSPNSYLQFIMSFYLMDGDAIQVTDKLYLNLSINKLNNNDWITFNTPIDIFINFTSSNQTKSGQFNFIWTTYSMPKVTYKYLTVKPQELGPVALSVDDFTTKTSYIINATSQTQIFASKVTNSGTLERRLLEAKNYFIYAGVGTGGRYIGSIFDIVYGNKQIFFDNQTKTITIVLCESTVSKYCMLFKPTSELTNNFSYSVLCYTNEYLSSLSSQISPSLTSPVLPQAVTIITTKKSLPLSDIYLKNLMFTGNTTRVDILPGATTPPFKPLISFSPPNWSYYMKEYVPGIARTFVVYNGGVNFTLQNFDKDIYLENGVNTTGVVPSLNYPFYGYDQETNYIKLDVDINDSVWIKFTCLVCNKTTPFNIGVSNGSSLPLSYFNYSLGSDSLTLFGKNFYVRFPSYSNSNSGGLISYTSSHKSNITSTPSSTPSPASKRVGKQGILISLILFLWLSL